MKKKHKRLISLITSLALIIPATFATSANAVTNATAEQNLSKLHVDTQKIKEIVGQTRTDYMNKVRVQINNSGRRFDDNSNGSGNQLDPDANVRLIVELNDPAAKDYVKSGTSLFSVASDSSVKNSILSKQSTYKAAVQQINPNASIRNSFYSVINGFSLNAKAKDIDAIREIPGIKKVTIANQYYPAMNSAKDLCNVTKVWNNTSGFKGEGMVVAIVDSGIDSTHKDMKLSPTTTAKLHKGDSIISNGPGKFFTDKVPYGYNFADKNDDIIDRNPGTGMHGMHVSGIVAANGDDTEIANNNAIKGVAPEAQLLAMKVFSNNPAFGSAFSDDIIAAIDDAVGKGADVINMSLGSPSGYVEDTAPEQIAVNNAVNSGVMVCIAAGNEQYSTAPYKLNNLYDTGIVGSPATSKDALMVASFENGKITGPALDFQAGIASGSAYYTTSEINPVGVLDNPDGYELVDCGMGQVSDFTGKNLKGKIALIKRGVTTFIEKKQNAQAAGAVGAIIFNRDNTYLNMATDASVKIPGVFINNADGVKLQSLIANGVKVKFNGTIKVIDNAAAGSMSDFSSWGPTPSLDLRPYISAPGGNIWSTVNNNSYENMSGTSMATPFTSGLSALVLQSINANKNEFSKVAAGKDKVELAKALLVNTANVQIDPIAKVLPASPRRQGAGLADVSAAVNNKVTALFNNNGNNEPVVSLKEITPVFQGYATKQFNVVLHNYGTKDVTYTAKDLYGVMTEQNKSIATMSYDVPLAGAKLSFDGNSTEDVTVPAGEDKTVNVTLAIPSGTKPDQFAEGFIRFESSDPSVPSIGMPYTGFYGNWNDESVMDAPIWDPDNSVFSQETVLTPATDGSYNYLGFAGFDDYGTPIINKDAIGINPTDKDANTSAVPCLSFLRNAKDNIIEIVDSKNNVVRQIAQDFDMAKSCDKTKYAIDSAWTWDGTLYNASTGKYEPASDGKYNIRISNKLDYPNATEKTFEMPVKIDTAAPNVTDVSYTKDTNGQYNLKFKAADSTEGTGLDSFAFMISTHTSSDPIIYKVDGNALQKLQADKDGYYTFSINGQPGIAGIIVAALDYAGNIGLNAVDTGNIFITSPQNKETFNSGDFDVNFIVNPDILSGISGYQITADPASDTDGSKITVLGNVDNTKTTYRVKGMEPGTYTISVNAIPNDPKAKVVDSDSIIVTINGSQTLGLNVTSPAPGAYIGSNSVDVTGTFKTMPDKFTINDKDAMSSIDKDKLTFKFNLDNLAEGLNKIQLYAENDDKFGKVYDKAQYSIDVYCDTYLPIVKFTNSDAKQISSNPNTYVVYLDKDAKTYTVTGTVGYDKDGSMGYRMYLNGDQLVTVLSGEVPFAAKDTQRTFSKELSLKGKETTACIEVTNSAGLKANWKFIIRRMDYPSLGIDFDNLYDGATLIGTNPKITGHYNIDMKPESLKLNETPVTFSDSDDTFFAIPTLTTTTGAAIIAVTGADSKGNQFSQNFNVTCVPQDTTPPAITIKDLSEDGSISVDANAETYELTGTVSDDNNGVSAQIDANSTPFDTIKSNPNENTISFDESIPLDNDITNILITATDIGDNTTSQSIKVIRANPFGNCGIHFDRQLDNEIFNTREIRFKGTIDNALEYFSVNGKPVTIFKDGTFDTVLSLSEGVNSVEIKAKAASSTNSIDKTIQITCDTTDPIINITSPADITKPIVVLSSTDKITVSGNIAEANGIIDLTINGKKVNINKDNTFTSGDISLTVGNNIISLVTQDIAGNYGYKTITVNRLSSQDTALAAINIDGLPLLGFDPNVTDYTVVTSNILNVPSVSYVIPYSDMNNSKVSIVNAASIPGTTKVTVQSQDGTLTKTYNINFVHTLSLQLVKPAVTQISLESDPTITFNATNNANSSKDATLVVTLLDSNNRMITYGAAHETIAPNGTVQLSVKLNLPAYCSGYKIRCFVVDSLDTMKPLSDITDIIVK